MEAMADCLARQRRKENVAALNGEISVLRESLAWDPDSLPASTWNTNVPFMAWVVEVVGPRCAVALGCGEGESFRSLCHAMARFSAGGKCIGIDQWAGEGRGRKAADARFESLREFCDRRYPDTASLRRVDLTAAAEQFADHSVDLLHLARHDFLRAPAPSDLSIWVSKVRPGGLILVSSGLSDDADEASRKAWLSLADSHPAVAIPFPEPLGIVQIPARGSAPLADFLSSHVRIVTALFRSLGERVEFRHVLQGEPTSASDIRKHLARIRSEHSQEIRRLETIHRAEQQSLEERLEVASEQVLTSMFKVNDLESETNLLLAKLAHYSARHASELEDLASELEALRNRYHGDIGELQRQLAARDAEIGAIHATKSWRLTKPLRMVQRLARLLRRGRR